MDLNELQQIINRLDELQDSCEHDEQAYKIDAAIALLEEIAAELRGE